MRTVPDRDRKVGHEIVAAAAFDIFILTECADTILQVDMLREFGITNLHAILRRETIRADADGCQ